MSGALSPLAEERLAAALGRAVVRGDDHVSIAIERRAEVDHVMRIGRETGSSVGIGRGAIRLDLAGLTSFELDTTSLLLRVGVGWTLQALDTELGRHGLMFAPWPASSIDRRLGAVLAAPRGSEASPRIGTLTQLVYAVDALLPDGTELVVRGAPRKAAGPELWQLLIGSRGALGVLLGATLRVERRAESRRDAAWEFPSLGAAIACARALLLDGVRPLDLAVSGAAQLSCTFEGPTALCEASHRHVSQLAQRQGGTPIPHAPLPRFRTPPSEQRIALDRLHLLPALPKEGRLVGWHLGGATLIDPVRAYSPPTPSPLLLAMKRRLDPNQHLVELS